MTFTALLCLLFLTVSHPADIQADDVQTALASMDKLADGLRTLSFRFRLLAVEGQKAQETHRGIVRVGGLQGGDYEALVEIERPAAGRIYYRGQQLLMVDSVNKEANQVELKEYAALVSPLKLLMLGTAGKRVAAAFDITAGGSEKIGSVTATKLELRPKAKEAREYVEKVDLWVPATGGFPLRLELMLSGLMRFEFSDVKANPTLPGSLRPK